MSKTKHLDSMLDTFTVKPGHKRAARKAQVDLLVILSGSSYVVQANGRTVDDGGGTMEEIEAVVARRVARIEALDKTVSVEWWK